MTPEEYETILFTVDEFKANAKVYITGFTSFGFGFTYWQRSYLPRSFYLFALTMGVVTGLAFGALRTAWHLVEKVDALGKDYELSRIVKQDIFDTRPDMNSGLRA